MKSMTDWQAQINDKHLDNFADLGFFVLDIVFDEKTFKICNRKWFCQLQTANLATGERLAHIRGDNIRWIDKACPVGQAYLDDINNLGKFLIKCFIPISNAVKHITPITRQGLAMIGTLTILRGVMTGLSRRYFI